jgi:hypothetical protein
MDSTKIMVSFGALSAFCRSWTILTTNAPLNGTVEIGGPEPFYLDGLLQRVLGARNDPREVIADPHVHYFGIELSERSLIPGDEAELGEIRFDDWLGRTADPDSESERSACSRSRRENRAITAHGERIPCRRSAGCIGAAGRRLRGVQRRGRFLCHPGDVYAQAGSIV